MRKVRDQNLRGFAIAVGAVALATAMRFVLGPVLGSRVSSGPFLIAILLAGRYGGLGPSWLALALATIPVGYLQFTRTGTFDLSNTSSQTSLAVYFSLGMLIIFLSNSERAARRRAEGSAAEALLKQGLLEREVAQRKGIEEQLRQRQQQLELALEAGRLGIWSWELRSNQFETTETQAVIHGRSADRTRLHLDDTLAHIHPDDRQIVRGAISGTLRDDAPERLVYRTVWPDSSVHWVETVGKVFRDETGRPERVLGVSIDITAKKVAEDVVRASEARLQAILDNTTAVIYLKDTAGRYITVNRRWEELFHVKREQIAGQNGKGVFSQEVMQSLQLNDDQVHAAGQPLVFEESVPQDGELHTYISVKFPIKDEQGTVVAVGGISTDISELKRTTEALIGERELLKKMMEVQEKEKQVICYDIHDGMIQYVAGALMLVEGFAQSLPAAIPCAELEKAIDSLRRALDEGRRVIRGMRSHVLDHSGVIAGIEDLIHQVSGGGLSIEFDKDERIQRLPKSLETAVYRVVQEALTNASKHSGSRRVCVDLHRTDGQVQVAVRDFGCGFNVNEVRRHGFGLLSMTERVRLLGGECSIHSEPGSGTQVIARLPLTAGID